LRSLYLSPITSQYVTYPIIPFLGFKIGELLIILVYFSVIISFCFAETSTSPPPLSIIGFSSRSGKIAIATTPFTILLSGRNNIVSLLLGIPYEKLRIYHFWIGRITLLCALLHVCGKLKTADGTTFEVEANRYGLLAFISLCVLFVGSLSWIMKWCYEVFWVIHFVTIAVFIAGESRSDFKLGCFLKVFCHCSKFSFHWSLLPQVLTSTKR